MRTNEAEVVIAGHICLDLIPALSDRGGADAGAGAGKDKDRAFTSLLAPGKVLEVGSCLLSTGGTVSNTGIALHRLGFAAKLMGKVGDDLFGQAVLDLLQAAGERLDDGMIVASGESTSYSVVISPPGLDRLFLHCTGANDTFSKDDISFESMDSARLFHFGYPPLMKRMYLEGGSELKSIFATVKAMGLTTSMDLAQPDPDSVAGRTDWKAILSSALPYVDVFLPSFEEILFMLDRERYERLVEYSGGKDLIGLADGELLRDMAGSLLAMGAAVVGIKLGERGLYVRTSSDRDRIEAMGRCRPACNESWLGRELWGPCYSVKVAGTTGAGDCTIAGFLGGLLKGLPLEEVLAAALATGAFNVEKPDAVSGIPSWETMEQRVAAGWDRLFIEGHLRQYFEWDHQNLCGIGPSDRVHDRR